MSVWPSRLASTKSHYDATIIDEARRRRAEEAAAAPKRRVKAKAGPKAKAAGRRQKLYDARWAEKQEAGFTEPSKNMCELANKKGVKSISSFFNYFNSIKILSN